MTETLKLISFNQNKRYKLVVWYYGQVSPYKYENLSAEELKEKLKVIEKLKEFGAVVDYKIMEE